MMQIARPPEGFRIKIPPAVDALVEAKKHRSRVFAQHWDDLLDRLKFTAHREGVPDDRLGKGIRVFVAEADPVKGAPRIVLLYHVLGDTVTIKMARL